MSGKKVNEAQQNKDNSADPSLQDKKTAENEQKQQQNSDAQNVAEQPPVEQQPEQVKESIEELKALIDNEKDRYLRLMAEFDNYKKRISRDYDRLVESANEKLMIDLIDVRENFDRAIRSVDNSTDTQSLFDGIKLIYNKFESVLQKNGLEVFASTGDLFDPMVHDALMKTANQEIPEDHIADVYEKGYKLKGRVIKHAKVIVSSGPQS
ncbi:MAG TPA: nucleotide exchange factor GrpE [Chitinispirillaceae bacterium]|nr:nucleotide exchange factor GrpE [Chitinispirillaceae bacterium]